MKSVLAISFSSLKHDGRSFNIIKTLSSKHKVSAISLDQSNDTPIENDSINHFGIQLNPNSRHFFRWQYFTKQAFRIGEVVKPKVIIACDLYALKAAVKIKKEHNCKLIYDSREIYSALGPLSKSALKQFVLSRIEKSLVHFVDEFVVSGELDADYLRSHFNTDKPFKVIMNVPPYQAPIKSNILRKRYPFLRDKTILLYQGVVLEGRGLDKALEILAADDSLGLAVLGEGIYLSAIKQKAQEMGLLDRIAFCGNIPYKELHSWTCSADIGLCLIEPISFSYRLALPNKMFEYIMAGIPQIATDLPAMKKVIDEHKIGKSVSEKFDIIEINEKIHEIVSNYEVFKSNCLESAKTFNYSTQEDIIFGLIDNL